MCLFMHLYFLKCDFSDVKQFSYICKCDYVTTMQQYVVKHDVVELKINIIQTIVLLTIIGALQWRPLSPAND